jgi:hypothetical protein
MRFVSILIAAALYGQQPGLAPPAETGPLFNDLIAQSARLQPLLKQIKPNEWTLAGAPQSYAALWESISQENQNFAVQAKALARAPEKLADSLRLLEQMHSIQENVSALLQGVAKYQNPALAELISGIQTEGKPARDAYSQRVLDLVTERESQFLTADHEAQRCRTILSKDPHAGQRR